MLHGWQNIYFTHLSIWLFITSAFAFGFGIFSIEFSLSLFKANIVILLQSFIKTSSKSDADFQTELFAKYSEGETSKHAFLHVAEKRGAFLRHVICTTPFLSALYTLKSFCTKSQGKI